MAKLNGHIEPHDLKQVCKHLSVERDILYPSQFDRRVSWRMPHNGSTTLFNIPLYNSTNGQLHMTLSDFSEELSQLQPHISVMTHVDNKNIVTQVLHYAQSQLGTSFSQYEVQILYQSVEEPAAL